MNALTFPDLEALQDALDANDPSVSQRVQRVMVGNTHGWIKRVERLKGRMHLQKGDPVAAFAREVAQHQRLAKAGAPVPEILLLGPDFIVTSDTGQPLNRLLLDLPKSELAPILIRAAQALADLHRKGLSHGRPSLKDLCWDGQKITFLDFERTHPKRDTVQGHGEDLVMFIFNALAVNRGHFPELDDAVATYLKAAPKGVLEAAKSKIWLYRLVSWTTAPLRLLRQSKELLALPITVKFLQNLEMP